jgi:hypothetical protein
MPKATLAIAKLDQLARNVALMSAQTESARRCEEQLVIFSDRHATSF